MGGMAKLAKNVGVGMLSPMTEVGSLVTKSDPLHNLTHIAAPIVGGAAAGILTGNPMVGIQTGTGLAGLMGSMDANKSNQKANSDALEFERQKEATRASEYQQNVAMQKAQWDAHQRLKTAYLRSLGVDIPDAAPDSGWKALAAAGPGAKMAAATPALTLGMLARGPQPGAQSPQEIPEEQAFRFGAGQ